VAVYCAVMLAVNTLAFWMPSLIHGAGIGQRRQVGLLSAVPYLAGCVFMLACGRSATACANAAGTCACRC
jgi:hypothetical protein